ncbi:hypothetical protein [Rhizobium leguminosarum]
MTDDVRRWKLIRLGALGICNRQIELTYSVAGGEGVPARELIITDGR